MTPRINERQLRLKELKAELDESGVATAETDLDHELLRELSAHPKYFMIRGVVVAISH